MPTLGFNFHIIILARAVVILFILISPTRGEHCSLGYFFPKILVDKAMNVCEELLHL